MEVKLYDYIIIDVFNYCYRKKAKCKTKEVLKYIINSINDDVLVRLKKDGVLYLLFDPIPENDLNIEKSFKYSGVRKEIVSDYKQNRSYDSEILAICSVLKKYCEAPQANQGQSTRSEGFPSGTTPGLNARHAL